MEEAFHKEDIPCPLGPVGGRFQELVLSILEGFQTVHLLGCRHGLLYLSCLPEQLNFPTAWGSIEAERSDIVKA
ncbi:hypothetical protein J6590_026692 [Homalodisca vitripennis]|nr:hypothetical protein J6590_026692 [Homalodisca vitripennis]